MITAYGTIERAVAAMQAGAFDFVVKPFQNDELFRIVAKANQSRIRRRREPAQDLMSAIGVGAVPLPLFGKSESAAQFRSSVERISKGGASVMMWGEIGTGKRSVAQEIHRKSDRARGPFIQVNLEAVPSVFQSTELFGVEKGASPVHHFSKPGTFELAQGGTLFIEEIDALSIESQNLFFNAISNESFSRIGGIKQFPMDFRVIATSSKDLAPLVRDGRFHVELYYHLSVEQLQFLPLRERLEDLVSDFIPYFIEKAARKRGIPAPACPESVISLLEARTWSGNLGELERAIAQAVNRSGNSGLVPGDFS
jgi:two-component system response regulator AtoC